MMIQGVSLSQGIAVGNAFVYRDLINRDITARKIYAPDMAYEFKRLKGSIETVKRDLHKMSRLVSQNISTSEAAIFEAQRAMLEDTQFLRDLEEELHSELINAELVTRNVFRKYIERATASPSETVQAKVDDLHDLFQKVLRNLLGIDTCILERLPPNAIVVATRLLPSDTMRLDRRNVAGIVVQEGSIHSHSALLARSLAIPSVCMQGQPIDFIAHGDELIVDGITGTVFHRPDAKTRQDFKRRKRELFAHLAQRHTVSRTPVQTRSGTRLTFYANVNNELDILQAIAMGCEGIGLLRLESLYLESELMPTEQELQARLHDYLGRVGPGLLSTLRLLDIGGDKGLPYLGSDGEINSFLGLRGIRLLLANPNLLLTQLRVALRLRQEFNVRLLIPMVSTAREVAEVRTLLQECQDQLEHRLRRKLRSLPLGAMIETPAAVLGVGSILEVSDFISIGTNDLIQYTMAAGRGNPEVSSYYDLGARLVLPFIRQVAQEARRQGIECSVCGEMASMKASLADLVEAGIRCVSVTPARIPELKEFAAGLP